MSKVLRLRVQSDRILATGKFRESSEGHAGILKADWGQSIKARGNNTKKSKIVGECLKTTNQKLQPRTPRILTVSLTAHPTYGKETRV